MTRIGRVRDPVHPHLDSPFGVIGIESPVDPETGETIDWALEGDAFVPEAIAIGTISVVQAKAFGDGGASGAISGPHSLDAPPTAGNIMVAILGTRATAWDAVAIEDAWPAGWTTLVGNNFAAVDSYGHVVKGKVSAGAADQSITFESAITGSLILAETTGFGGALPAVLASAVDDITDSATPTVPAITPAAGYAALIIASSWKKAANPDPGPQTLTDYTGLASTAFVGSGNRHRLTAWYRVVDPTSGSAYGPVSASTSGDGGDDSNVIHLAIGLTTGTQWVLAPKTVDGADATYHQVDIGDVVGSLEACWMIILDNEKAFVRARLRIACQNAGSRTYALHGADLADFSDEEVIGSTTFTATGTYTAQDVTITGTPTEAFAYYRIVGTDELRRIHEVELYEATPATGEELDAHITDTTAAHAASAVSFTPVGTIAATDAQTAIAEVATDAAAALSAHETDTVDAHDASAISFVPTGTIAATDVQAAIAEVASEAGGGYTDPLTTRGDIVRRGAAATERLALGTTGHVLTSDGTDAVWQASASGFSNPMTTAGDIIKGGTGGAAERLAVGTEGHVLSVVSGVPAWAAAAAGGAVHPGLAGGTLARTYTFDSTVESWTTTAGTLSSTGSRLRLAHSAAAVALEPSGAADVPDGEIACDYGVVSVSGSTSLIFRATDASNFYMFVLGTGPSFYKCVAGSFTLLLNINTVAGNPFLPSTLVNRNIPVLIRFVGPEIQLYVHGTMYVSVYDTVFTTGRVGIRADNATMEVDNVKVYTL